MFGKQRIDRRYLLQEPQRKSRSRRIGWAIFTLTAIAALSLGAINIANAAIHPQAELNSSDHSAGHLEFTNEHGHDIEALHLGTDVNISVSGMVATVNYEQQFRNDSDQWLEAKYLFPLPETAAVNAMEIKIGERVIKGEIKEKQKARQIYQQAKKNGQRASLVEQQRPNMFSQKVANIGPGEIISVSIHYVQKVEYQFGEFSLRLPLTITPRYIPGTPLAGPLAKGLTSDSDIVLNGSGWGWAAATDQVPDADFITPFMKSLSAAAKDSGQISNTASITIALDAGLPLAIIESPYHDINISRTPQHHLVELSRNRETMDRDFVLQWQPVINQMPAAALFGEKISTDVDKDHDYIMLMLLPPQENSSAEQNKPAALPRDVTFIIDTSGSMQGTSITQAKDSLHMALQSLSPQDHFSIIEFNSKHRRYKDDPIIASRNNIINAQQYVSQLNAGGGTEMFAPLKDALTRHQYEREQAVEQIVFITDGSVGNEQALFQLIHENLASARLFTVAIGSAPNSFFMRKAAQFGRGSFTHIGNSAEVSEKMTKLFSQLQSPVLRDIKIDWPESINVEMFPQRIPDLYTGQPLLITAKISAEDKNSLSGIDITVSGDTASAPWTQTLSVSKPVLRTGVGSLWARDKISALLDKKSSGVSEDKIKPDVLKVALTHQLISPYTSFIAVEKAVARPADKIIKTKAIANITPKGQSLQAHTYPQGALGLPWKLLLGLIALILALLINNTQHPMSRADVTA